MHKSSDCCFRGQSQVTLLNPYQSVLYTWDDPSQERTLIWNLYNRKRIGFPARINRDGYGFEKVSFHSLRKTLVQQPSLRYIRLCTVNFVQKFHLNSPYLDFYISKFLYPYFIIRFYFMVRQKSFIEKIIKYLVNKFQKYV